MVSMRSHQLGRVAVDQQLSPGLALLGPREHLPEIAP
jgi:hypothetical protein